MFCSNFHLKKVFDINYTVRPKTLRIFKLGEIFIISIISIIIKKTTIA